MKTNGLDVGALLSAALICLVTLGAARPALAQDVMAGDPIQSGTGGPSTLTPPPSGGTAFTPSLTTGAQLGVDPATGSVFGTFPFLLPHARGNAQPSLALSYNSSNSTIVGYAGLGWTLNVPSITRRGAAGMPLFTDDVFYAPPSALATASGQFDEYLIDGQRLVPLCTIGTCTVPQILPGEVLPTALFGTSVGGWMYFRKEVDDGARYFFSPGGQTWIKQESSGVVTQFGRPIDPGVVDVSLGDGIERPTGSVLLPSPVSPPVPFDPSSAVYRWNIVRQSDASGNTIYYTWTSNAALLPGTVLPGTSYLSDIYDTVAVGQIPTPGAFAHHTHLSWQPGPIIQNMYTPIWRATPVEQLAYVDVTSASWSSSVRSLVRRYSLSYTLNTPGTRSRLASINLEGQCQSAPGVATPVLEQNNLVPNPSGCASPALLSLAQYTYSPDSMGVVLDTPWSALPDLPSAATTPTGGGVGGVGGSGPSGGSGEPSPGTWGGPNGSSPGSPAPFAEFSFVDYTGDGAADLIYTGATPGELMGASFSQTPSALTAAGLYAPFSTQYNIQTNLSWGNWLTNGAVSGLAGNGAYDPVPGGFTFSQLTTPPGGVCWLSTTADWDGDGIPDCLGASNGGVVTSQSVRTHGGDIFAFARIPPYQPPYTFDITGWVASVCPACANNELNGYDFSRSFADIDGDGLAEPVLTLGAGWTDMYAWQSHGDTGYGTYDGDSLGPPGASNAQHMWNTCAPDADNSHCTDDLAGFENVMVADVNLDGYADFLTLNLDTITVCPHVGPSVALDPGDAIAPYEGCYYVGLPPMPGDANWARGRQIRT